VFLEHGLPFVREGLRHPVRLGTGDVALQDTVEGGDVRVELRRPRLGLPGRGALEGQPILFFTMFVCLWCCVFSFIAIGRATILISSCFILLFDLWYNIYYQR